MIMAEIGERLKPLREAVINGRHIVATPNRHKGGLSFPWSDLGPDLVEGIRGRVGRHRLEIEALGLRATTTVEVR
jgi:hypothetical protein